MYKRQDDNKSWTAPGTWEFLLKGIKIKWPGQLTEVWTDIWAPLIRWWMVTQTTIEEDYINPTWFSTALTRNRIAEHTINGVVRSDEDPLQTLTEMNAAADALTVDMDGQIILRPEGMKAATTVFTDADVVSGTTQITVVQPANDKYNTATMRLDQRS